LKSKALRISSLPEEFVVFDLETTGLSPHSDEILEIGAIKVNRDSNVSSGLARCQTFQTLVKPSGHIPAMITKINGISEQMVDKDGESIETALKGFMSFVGDLPLVSYNADFDMGFIESAANKYGIPVTNSHVCALKMARRAWPRRKNYKLCDMAKDGQLSDADAHRALGDCQRTLIIFVAAVKQICDDKRTRPRRKAKNNVGEDNEAA